MRRESIGLNGESVSLTMAKEVFEGTVSLFASRHGFEHAQRNCMPTQASFFASNKNNRSGADFNPRVQP